MNQRLVNTLVLVAVLCSLALALPAAGEIVLKPGDRMVFLGDSITQQMIHTRYVMNYIALRHPELKVTFRNAGWGGDRAPGALARLQRDVLDLKPNVVSICLGMNDARYQAFDQATYDTYMQAMRGLVSELKKAGVNVVLLTPGCVDTDKTSLFKGYNDTLSRFADGVMQLGADEKIPTFNIHKLMLDIQTAAKAANPAFTMIPDGVHPSPPGQAIMAFGLLTALGCEGSASGLHIDVPKRMVSPDRCKVRDLKISDESISFTRTDEALPTFFDPEVQSLAPYMPSLTTMNVYMLTLNGLKEGNWSLSVQGEPVGTFTADELDMGVDLANKPGPWQRIREEVNRTSKKQEDIYFMRWRQIQLGKFPEEAQKEVDALLKKLDSVIADCESARAKAVAADRTWTWSLTFVQ